MVDIIPQLITIGGAFSGIALGWSLNFFSSRRQEEQRRLRAVDEALDACAVEMLYMMQHNSNNLRRLKEYAGRVAPRKLDIKKMKYTKRGFLDLGRAEIASLPSGLAPEMLHFLTFTENNEIELDDLLDNFEAHVENQEAFVALAAKLERRVRTAIVRGLVLINGIETLRVKRGRERLIDLADWLEGSPHSEIKAELIEQFGKVRSLILRA